MNFKLIDILFIIYVAAIIPVVSLFYFAIAITNFDSMIALAGGIILWAILIPYPVYKYIKKRVCPS